MGDAQSSFGDISSWFGTNGNVEIFRPYVGNLRSSKGAGATTGIVDGKFMIEVRGRFPFRSELCLLEQDEILTVFSVPGHPLSKQIGGNGILLVHDCKTGRLYECEGRKDGRRIADWGFEEGLQRTDSVGSTRGAPKTGVGQETHPVDPHKSIDDEEMTGKPRTPSKVAADAPLVSLRNRIEVMQNNADEVRHTLNAALWKSGKTNEIRAPEVKDLSRMAESELQIELDAQTTLHAEYKKQLEQIQAETNKTKRRESFTNATQGRRPEENDLLGPENEHGLLWNRKWEKSSGSPLEGKEDVRDKIRRGTREKVVSELGLRYFGDAAANARNFPPLAQHTRLYTDSSPQSKEGFAPAGDKNLLGRYDVLLVRARADYDWEWKLRPRHEHKSSFWIAHAAAINIGESTKAADFIDFSKEGSLDLKLYVHEMGHIMDNITKTTNHVGAEHFIFFPFGLGAFVRHLQMIDPIFSDERKMQELRRETCRIFAEKLAGLHRSIQIHLCISFMEGEPQMNADAFLRAFSSTPNLKERTTIWPNGDSLQLANELAAESRHVVLVNGANRRLIGNHWFGKHALRAIDENLHRRSWSLSALSYMLNDFGGEPSSRGGEDLKLNVDKMGGQVIEIPWVQK